MAIDFIDREEFERIINYRDDICISIYLPMVRKGRDVQGNAVQLEHALEEVADVLEDRGWNQSRIDDLLAQPYNLVEDPTYWQQQEEGLALFIAPDLYEVFRLPTEFEALTVAGERFHIKPLLPLINENRQFYILALSQKSVRLFHGTRYALEERDVEQLDGVEVPVDVAEALAYDDPEEQLQHHTSTSGSTAGPQVVHHGHGVGDEKDVRLRRFLQQVARGLADFLEEKDDPLVLAAVQYLHPMFAEVFRLSTLLDEGIDGNPDQLSDKELRERAWQLVAPRFAEARERAETRFNELVHSEQATDDLQTIVPAAFQGRVDALFVAINEHSWGHYDPEKNDVVVGESDQRQSEDLLDFAALQTLANGGTVFAVDRVDMPGRTPIAAVLRF
jgi:hypothetical protein